jgi:hypothetical protein
MKKNHLAILSLFFFTCLIIFSCRRDIQNILNDQVVPTAALEAAKVWHGQNSIGVSTSNTKLNPKWNSSWMLKTDNGQFLVVSAPEKRVTNKDYKIRRVFVFSISGDRVTNGIIMEFVGYKYNVADNLDKLISNYRQGFINGFTGTIFEYDINYRQSNSAVYENGKRVNAKSDFVSVKGKAFTAALQLLSTNKLTTFSIEPTKNGFPPDNQIGPDCILNYEVVEYYTNDRLTDIVWNFKYMICPSENSSGSDESGSGSASNTSEDPQSPNYGGVPGQDGSGSTGLPPSFQINLCNGLTDEQRTTLTSAVNEFKTSNCAAKYLSNYYRDRTFTVCISSNITGSANISTTSNTITFSSAPYSTTPDVTLHEFFHAYQNSITPGGTSNYGMNAQGVKSSGYVDIEFEQAVFADILYNDGGAFLYRGSQEQKARYNDWITSVRANGYPKLTPNTTAYNDFINTYKSFLTEYNDLSGNPNHSTALNLNPVTLINIFNNINPNCQ